MMKKIIVFFLLTTTLKLAAQNCAASFSYSGNSEVIYFQNLSSIPNAHYFWDFGDGSGTNHSSAIHEYFGNGSFYVTLYGYDTINNCSAHFSSWINVVKYSADPCQSFIDDSFFVYNNQNYIKIIDNSNNCQGYVKNYFSLGGNNSTNTHLLYDNPSNFISILIQGNGGPASCAFKSGSWHFNRGKNYTQCSANFEFIPVSEDNTGQNILFRAMNKDALTYEWTFTGFGDAIHRYSDTATIRFPDPPYNNIHPTETNIPWLVYLTTVDHNGCRDSLVQYIIVKSKASTYVGIKEHIKNDIQVKLIPNPVKDWLKLEFDESKFSINKLNITNSLGQLVFVLNDPKSREEIDISFLLNGIYYLKVENKNGQRVFKLIKE